MLLGASTELVRLVTGSTVSALSVHARFADYSSTGAITPDRQNSTITTAGTNTVVAAPGGSTKRLVKSLNLVNEDASVSTTVAIQIYDGTTAREQFGVTMLPGENLEYLDGKGWRHLDANGAEYFYAPTAPGNLGATGTIAENMPRAVAGTSTTAGTSGTLYMAAIYLYAGQVVSNITITSGATLFTTPTNYFFALYSGLQSAPALLAQSANQTTTAWAANTVKTLAMTTPYKVPTSGIYYVAVMVTATTMGTFNGPAALTNTTDASAAPILFAASSTGLTTSLPNPAAALSFNGTAARFRCAVS